MKDTFMYLFDLIVIVSLVRWIWKVSSDEKKDKQSYREYNLPENRFKRKKQAILDLLEKFSKTYNYPYILLPNYQQRKNVLTNLEFQFEDYSHASELEKEKTKALYSSIKEGRTEAFFYERLLKRFEKKFLKKGGISFGVFYPDFTYMDFEKQIFIDIEIDEMYSLSDKQPLHYVRKIKAFDGNFKIEDKNSYRDELFRKKGWTVVRFSEDQILNSAKECIDCIELIVNYWTEDCTSSIDIDETVLLHKRWNFDMAIETAKLQKREVEIDVKMKAYLLKENLLKYNDRFE